MLLKSVLMGFLSFSILHAETLKECKNETDKISGCVKRDYHSNGNLWRERPFKNGDKEGIEKWYYENGNLEKEMPFKNDKVEGIAKRYDKMGNLQIEASFLNDRRQGDIRCYTTDKKLLALLKAKNDKIIIGKWYYENGNIKLEITYKDSKQEGVMKMYDTGGRLRAEVSALNRVLHGDTKLYTEDKKLFAIIMMRYGETIFSKCFNGRVLTDKELSRHSILNDTEKAINYLQDICLKESDS